MPDPRFFKKPEPVKISVLAEKTGAGIFSDRAADLKISDVAPLDQAGHGDLTFLDNIKYRSIFHKTKATACIVHPDYKDEAPEGVAIILSETPYMTYALYAQFLYPEEHPETHVSDKARISSLAKLPTNIIVQDGAVIKDNVEIGEGSWIGANAVIDKNVVLGKGCRIGAGAVISHSIIGNNVRIYPGCCVGQDGFGFAIHSSGFVKVPQLGRVIIEDGVEIGSNTCVDRGSGPDTLIGAGTWIDNLVQIGHNVKIGKFCVIVSQCGVSGSTALEDYVVLGGQVGVAGHITIGKATQIGAQSGVMRDVPAGQEYIGSPAQPIKSFMKQVALLRKMVKNKDFKVS